MSEFCTCPECIDCCWHNPGWFGSITEIKGAAKILNISLKDLANEYLIQEYWAGKENIVIPAPRRDPNQMNDKGKVWIDELKKNSKGFVRASWGHNFVHDVACIFFKDNRCVINSSKPKECRETFGCKQIPRKRPGIVKYWQRNQDWIEKNLMVK